MLLILQRQWRFLGKLLLAQVAIGLLAIPWLFMLPGQISKIQTAFWTPPPGITELLQSIILFHASIPLPGIWLIIGAILSVQIIFLVILQSYRDKEDRSGIYFLALFVILPPALIFVVSYMMRPVFVTRGFIASSLAYYGLMGIIIARYWQTGLGKIIAGLFVATVMIALPYQVSYNDFPRAPYREAMEYLGAKVRPGDSVVHDNKLSYFPSKYYAPNLPQNFLADQPNSPNDTLAPNTQEALGIYPQKDLSSAVGSSAQVYFIVFQETINEYISGGENDHPALAWLKQHYQFVDQTNFRDLEIFHYSRP
jgi:mannosyltransferase